MSGELRWQDWITAMAWSAWVIGVLAFISAGSALLIGGNLIGRSAATH